MYYEYFKQDLPGFSKKGGVIAVSSRLPGKRRLLFYERVISPHPQEVPDDFLIFFRFDRTGAVDDPASRED